MSAEDERNIGNKIRIRKICLILPVNYFTGFLNGMKTSFCQLPKTNQHWYKVKHFVHESVSVTI